MKRMICLLLLLTMVFVAHGQGSADYNQRLYLSYVKGEMGPWKGIIQEMDREYERTGDQTLLYYLCFAYYGYVGYLINEDEGKAVKKDLEAAKQNR